MKTPGADPKTRHIAPCATNCFQTAHYAITDNVGHTKKSSATVAILAQVAAVAQTIRCDSQFTRVEGVWRPGDNGVFFVRCAWRLVEHWWHCSYVCLGKVMFSAENFSAAGWGG